MNLPTPLLVLGLGNDVLGDDAIGLILARMLHDHPALPVGVEVRENDGGSLSLLDDLSGFEQAILVDAVVTGTRPPGTLQGVEVHELPRLPGTLPHGLGLRQCIELGEALGLPMPRHITILTVEIEDPYSIREGLTSSLLAALPNLVHLLLARVSDERPPGAPAAPDAFPASPLGKGH